MPKIASLLTLICVLTQWGATASAQTCEYAGQTFSPGSTVCEWTHSENFKRVIAHVFRSITQSC